MGYLHWFIWPCDLAPWRTANTALTRCKPPANLGMVNYFWSRYHSRPSNKTSRAKLFSCLWEHLLTYRTVLPIRPQQRWIFFFFPESRRERKGLCTFLKYCVKQRKWMSPRITNIMGILLLPQLQTNHNSLMLKESSSWKEGQSGLV